ncbi:hypothetical protein ACCO45_006007 [Purpureocillium lilacinum]|uniref:Uncharacterized protein n=1 Tax=Purpureocillium lilacinum TaxID=33203 RepID=A0ACC4DZU4_PURLI
MPSHDSDVLIASVLILIPYPRRSLTRNHGLHLVRRHHRDGQGRPDDSVPHHRRSAEAAKLGDLPQARLCEDMKPLVFQVHTATNLAAKMVARLSGQEPQDLNDNLVSYDDMRVRITEVLNALASADKDLVNKLGEESAPTVMGPGRTLDIPGKAFAMGAAMPNIFFHVSMAYAILRKEGVPLGKKDFIMSFVGEHVMKAAQ